MTDADILSLYAELTSLLERAATKERDAAILMAQAQTKNNEAAALKVRAEAVKRQLSITI